MSEIAAMDLSKNDVIILMGTLVSRQEPHLAQAVDEALKNGTKLVLFSAMEDISLSQYDYDLVRYEAGTEDGVVSILVKSLLEGAKLPDTVAAFFEEIDDGYICAESNVGEEEIEEVQKLAFGANNPIFILSKDVLAHQNRQDILMLIKILTSYTNIKSSVNDNEKIEGIPQLIEELETFNGTLVYTCKPQNPVEKESLIGSKQFAIAAKISDGNGVHVKIKDSEYNRVFRIDSDLKGTIALLPNSDDVIEYPIQRAKITKREVQ